MGLWVENATAEVNAASQYRTIIPVCVVMTTFMLVIVSLRLYVRAQMLKLVGLDDWTIIFSAICSVIYNGLCIGQSKWGLGLPIALRPAANLDEYSVVNFAGRPFYQIGVLGFKVALCLAYLRILKRGQRKYRLFVLGVLYSCIAGHVAATLVLIFQCSPVRRSWLPETPGVCLPNVGTFYATAAITIFFDVIIFTMPIPILMGLQINLRRKTALIGIFALGLFTTICSIMRMIQIVQIAQDGNSSFLVLWGTIELNVGIALTCIPNLAPLFTYFREKSSVNSKSRRGYPSNSHELLSGNGQTSRAFGPSAKVNKDSVNDSDSQTGILGPDGGIKKTVEISVDVAVQRKGDGNESW